MDSDEDIPPPEQEGENGPPKKLSRRRFKQRSSPETPAMEVDTSNGDGIWNPGINQTGHVTSGVDTDSASKSCDKGHVQAISGADGDNVGLHLQSTPIKMQTLGVNVRQMVGTSSDSDHGAMVLEPSLRTGCSQGCSIGSVSQECEKYSEAKSENPLPGSSGDYSFGILDQNLLSGAENETGPLDVSMTSQPDFELEKPHNDGADDEKNNCFECGKDAPDGACHGCEVERPGTSSGYTPGGCDCSSELVATMVIQRHHTAGNCTICSGNNEFRPIEGVIDNTNDVPKTTDSHELVSAGTKEKDLEISSVDAEKSNVPPDHRPDGTTFAINDLPVPIILKIFGCLSRYVLLHKVAHVCKYWNRLSQDPELWRVLDFRGQFKLTNSILERLTSYSDHVTSIDLSDSKLISSNGVEALTKRCRALQVLKLSRCYSLMSPAYRSIGTNCPLLRKLFLDICYSLTDADMQWIAEGCPRLSTLSLNHCDSITDVGVKAVAHHCRQLEAINLDHLGKLSHESLLALSTNCPNLSTVSLMSAVMTDEGILHLTKLPNLRVLDISNIIALTKKSVTRIVTQCKNLAKLNICLMRWVDDTMIEVIARNGTALKTLHCVSCNITDNGLKILAENARNLEVLDVSWCNEITSDGVQFIAERCRTLRFISLIRCDRVTMETLTDFVERYPWIHFSSFFLDAQRLLKKAMKEGFI